MAWRITDRHPDCMTTLAVRVPDDLLATLDALVADGRYPNRTAAVTAALERLVADEHRRAVDHQIVDGYTRRPPAARRAFARSLARHSVEQEPWARGGQT
jgi:Arc/MetJ-type ribon-helix-helix transcriptional regulator